MPCSGDTKGLPGSVFLWILAICAAAFTVGSSLTCEFMEYRDVMSETELPTLPGPFLNSTSGSVGLWLYKTEDMDSCKLYEWSYDYWVQNPDDPSDIQRFEKITNNESFLTATWGAVAAGSCLFIVLVFVSIECCCVNYCTSRLWVSLFFFFAACAQGATFAMFTIEDMCYNGRDCTIKVGGILSIVAVFLYVVCMFLACALPKVDDPLCCRERRARHAKELEALEAEEEEEDDLEKGAAAAVVAAEGEEEEDKEGGEEEEDIVDEKAPEDEEAVVAAVEAPEDEEAADAAAEEEVETEPESNVEIPEEEEVEVSPVAEETPAEQETPAEAEETPAEVEETETPASAEEKAAETSATGEGGDAEEPTTEPEASATGSLTSSATSSSKKLSSMMMMMS